MSKLDISVSYGMTMDTDNQYRMLWRVMIRRGCFGFGSTFTCKPTRKQLRQMVKWCKEENWGKVYKK